MGVFGVCAKPQDSLQDFLAAVLLFGAVCFSDVDFQAIASFLKTGRLGFKVLPKSSHHGESG